MLIHLLSHSVRSWLNQEKESLTALVKNSCKNIYNTTVMGLVFQVEWWEKHPSGCSLGYYG